MEERPRSVTCTCGNAFEPPPTGAAVCPRCGNILEPQAPAPVKSPGTGFKHDTGRRVPPVVSERKRVEPAKEPPLPDPIPGYTFIRRLGSGGMGDVFLAKQESLDRMVAIKLLPPGLAQDKSYVEGFMKEARSAGKVTHENVMGAVDVGESKGRYYFVMEYVAGETLYRMIRQQKFLPEPRALDLARQVARGLRHALQHGLIHRDIKPKNILITPEGTAKLCDFGLAREVSAESNDEEGETLHTTPSYASPEQCRADPLDHRTDMYSLGISLFEALTGKRPFSASTSREIMTKQVTEEPPSPRSINPAVSEPASSLVLRMLRKRKEERFETYDELLAEFDALLGPRPPKTARGVPAAAHETQKRKRIMIGAAGAAGAAVLVAVLVFTGRGGKPLPPPAPPTPAARLDAEVQRFLDEVRALQRGAMGHPGEYLSVRARWKELEEKYASTPQRAIFAAGRVDFEAAVAAEAETLARDIFSDADVALKAGRPFDAIAALRKFPPELAHTPAGNRVAQKTLETERAIDEKFRQGVQAASAALGADKLEEARRQIQNLRVSFALETGGELRPMHRTQMDDLLRRIDEAATAKRKTDTLPAPDPKPAEVKGADPKPAVPAKTGNPAASPALPAAAAAHFLALRDPALRLDPEKRAAASAFFAAGRDKSAFNRAASVFLSRDDAAWKLSGPAAEALSIYLATAELGAPDKLTAPQHQALLESLVQKIAELDGAPAGVFQLFACAHLQEILAQKGKIDPALLIQARMNRAPVAELWGPASCVGRIEMAGLLLKPPGLWLTRAAEASFAAPDFFTRFLGALCVLKDTTIDGATASDRWKKLGSGAPDGSWTRLCDAVSDRLRQAIVCEICLGQGKYPCSTCSSAGILPCVTCKGAGRVNDPTADTSVTCAACKGRRAAPCTGCNGQKGLKCAACDGKKNRPLIPGSHFRYVVELGVCDSCLGAGSLFPSVAYPCLACDGNGRSFDAVPREFLRLPAWVFKGREGRALFAGLRWLARHQGPDGKWSPDAWTSSCKEQGCKAAPAAPVTVGVTSLALLAFLNAGLGPESEAELGGIPAGVVVRKAIAWLCSIQTADGLITHGKSPKPVFENHLATYALFTAAQLPPPSAAFPEKDRSQVRDSAIRALRWSLNSQAKAGGWGYTVGALSDSWVTSWGAVALLSGRDAGIEIPKINLTYLLQWYDGVTDKKDFHIGYTPQLMGKMNLTGFESFAHHDTLSALGSMVRMQIEGKATTTMAAADKLIERDLANPDPLRRDFTYWYVGTLFTAARDKRSGPGWTQWTQAVLREMIALQEPADNCMLGAWLPTDRWSAEGGNVYAVAMNALTLTQVAGTRPVPPAKK